jgi:hypothetical protein
MTESQEEFINGFNAAIKERCVYRYITRDSDLQRAACAESEEMLALVSEEKAKAIADADEHFSNVLLGCESLTKAIIAEIKMWLLLKEDKPDAAWSQLVIAQNGFENALKANEGFSEAARQLRRLHSIETLAFPPQTFLSTGWIVKNEICSICESDYEDCEHVKGRPYMGQFCYVRLIPQEIDHVSIVDSPASKHCRVLTMGVKGGKRNVMTWLIEPDEGDGNSEGKTEAESGGMTIQGTIATSSTLQEGAVPQ